MPVYSYEVGALFSIEDRATPTLERLGEGFAGLDAKITAIQERLASFGRGGGIFSGITEGVNALGASLEGLVGKATAAGEAMERAFRAGGEAAMAAARDVDGLTAAINRAADAAGAFGARSNMGSGGGGGSSYTPIPFDPRSYGGEAEAVGSDLVPLVEGGLAARIAGGGGGGRGGPPAPFFGYPRGGSGGWSSGALPPPAGFGGWSGGGAGPPGSGGPGFIPPGDEPFDPRMSLNAPNGRAGSRRGSHIAPLVEAAAVYEAMKAGAEEEQSIDVTLLRGFNIDPRKATDEQKQAIRALASRAAGGTSFSEREVAAGMPVLAAPLGFTGPEGMEQFTTVFEIAAKAAEAAKQLKFGTFEGSLAGAVEFAHQMRAYKPEELQPAMNRLGAITETLPHGDMEREALVMGYAIPQARALGADPMQAMTAIGFLQQSGLVNTVAATTLRQMMIGQMRAGGPLGAHIDHEKSQLEESLRLQPGHLSGRGRAGSEHDRALRDLGITDAAGKLQDMNRPGEGTAGGINIDRMLALLAQAQSRMTPVEFGKALYGAFGVRGETGGAIIAEALPQYRAYQARVAGTAPLNEQLQMIQGNSVQLTGQAIARVADLGNEIGTNLLPYLKQFDDAVITATGYLRSFVQEHPVATTAAVGGGIAATIVGGIATMRALPHYLGRFFSEGSAEAAGGALRGAGPRAGLLGLGALGVTAGAAHTGLEAATSTIYNAIFGQGAYERQGRIISQGAPSFVPRWLGGQQPLLPGDPGFAAAERYGPRASMTTGQTEPPNAARTVNMTVNNTMSGVADEATFKNLLHRLMDAIRNSLAFSTSDPRGSDQSPFTYPGGY